MPHALAKFEHRLPYASTLYGVYQPLLGWRSRRVEKRIERGLHGAERDWSAFVYQLLAPDVALNADAFVDRLGPAALRPRDAPRYDPAISSDIATRIASEIEGSDPADPGLWEDLIGSGRLDELLAEVGRGIREHVNEAQLDERELRRRVVEVAERESRIGGLVGYLHGSGLHRELGELFAPRPPSAADLATYDQIRELVNPQARGEGAEFDPLIHFDPKTDLDKVGLSPVGLVHLFRQFFFELDTFLGPPVQHIWLSAGSTVELVEVSTRRSVVEHQVERSLDQVFRTEREIVEREELSEAVQSDNESNTRFAASVSASQSIAVAEATETASFEVSGLQREARHSAHEHMRYQTDRLTTEIRQAYRTVFKAVTEVTDTTSKLYTLTNDTDDLVNYELRRKMRQVGVQVQDLGIRLCWQTYVDDPGRELGVAKLFHLAPPPDFSGLGPVNELPPAGEYTEEVVTSIRLYDWKGGVFSGDDPRPSGHAALLPKDGFEYESHGVARIVGGRGVAVEVTYQTDPAPHLYLLVVSEDVDDGEQTQVAVPVTYKPSSTLVASISERNAKLRAERDAEKDRLVREAYVKAARDRINAAVNVRPRDFDELREEERIVVYRSLIAQLLDVGVDLGRDTRVLHVVAELIESMFEVDRMLYFVAPEWWRPRMHRSLQSVTPELSGPPGKRTLGKQLHGTARRPVGLDEHTVGWGGVHETGRDNYYITETSNPAPLGSSLGWLIQLDGDNMRNAFLNAPWVKAVVPIRPDKELAALNWLSRAEVEGGDGLDDEVQLTSDTERNVILGALQAHDWEDPDLEARYQELDAGDLRVIDALRYLALKVSEQVGAARERVSEDLGAGVTLNYLRPDRVFENGFDPLEDGFRADPVEPYELFDEWVEVLPTDQVVAVEVEYDPVTGRQV